MSLQIKRGLEKYRSTYIPAEGELVYITDTKKLYVGDGYTAGGILITGTLQPPPTTAPPATTLPPTTSIATTAPPVTTLPPTTSIATTAPPVTTLPPTTTPPWIQIERIVSNITDPKVRQPFQIEFSYGKPNSTFTWSESGKNNEKTETLDSSGSKVLDFSGINIADTYSYDVYFTASGHRETFTLTIQDYDEKVDFSPVTNYDNQLFNFIFTDCEPGSKVSLERSSDAVDYSFYGNLQGTVDDSGNLTVPYSDIAGYWYYRFTFNTTNHTKDLPVQIYSYSDSTGTGGDGGGDS